MGVPWRVAFALQTDGWWLRSDIIWSKPNPMPESVTDRPTREHEYVFLLAKSERYYYDAEAIREESSPNTHRRAAAGKDPSMAFKMDERTPTNRNRNNSSFQAAMKDLPLGSGRNKRSVWNIATQPFPSAHFATFPEALVRPCILAGTSERGCCPECGAPWVREMKKSRHFESGSGRVGHLPLGKNGANLQGGGETLDIRRGPVVDTQTINWQPTCKHGTEPVPCRILDPFAGAGTVGVVAQKAGRSATLIDISEAYVAMMNERLAQRAFL